MCGIIQIVQWSWTKASRGGRLAEIRNRIPRSVEISADSLDLKPGELNVEIHRWSDTDEFAKCEIVNKSSISWNSTYEYGCVRVTGDEYGSRVEYQYQPTLAGMPDRRAYATGGHREAVTRTYIVRSGEWMQISYNGRFVDMDTALWWYEQATMNVACFEKKPNPKVFLENLPSQRFESLAKLW